MKRIATKISITISFMVLIWYAVAPFAIGRTVPLYLLIAPSIGILVGLNYLRLSAPEERGSGH